MQILTGLLIQNGFQQRVLLVENML